MWPRPVGLSPPRLLALPPTTLAGQHRTLSLQADTTADLWREFQLLLRAWGVPATTPRYSVQAYGPGHFAQLDPSRLFEKWAAVALGPGQAPPAGAEQLVLPGGLYAVFDYRGPVAAAPQVFGYLFGTWLPASGYELAERPHFEVLGEHFHRTAPHSEEEIWVPVQPAGHPA